MTARHCCAERRVRYVTAARAWLGTPYKHQASCQGVGADCLGLLRGVWSQVRQCDAPKPPAYSPDWNEAGGDEALWRGANEHLEPIAIEAAAAGDVLLFRMRATGPAKHLGLVSAGSLGGDGSDPPKIIHAYSGVGVIEQQLGNFWRRHIVAAFRFPED